MINSNLGFQGVFQVDKKYYDRLNSDSKFENDAVGKDVFPSDYKKRIKFYPNYDETLYIVCNNAYDVGMGKALRQRKTDFAQTPLTSTDNRKDNFMTKTNFSLEKYETMLNWENINVVRLGSYFSDAKRRINLNG
jgi:hypothetical protein